MLMLFRTLLFSSHTWTLPRLLRVLQIISVLAY